MRPDTTGARRRAVALLLSCLVLAGVGTFSHGDVGVPLDGALDQGAADLLHAARAQVGDRYLWGGNGPDAWDCSGLTRLWRGVPGVTGMPRVSRDQLEWAVPIPREQLLIGDLVFFNEPVDHVAIYAGDGRIVDASSAKAGVVERPLWKAAVVRYGRVPRPGMPAVLPWTPPPPPVAATGTDPLIGVPAAPAVSRSAAPRTSRSKAVPAPPTAKPVRRPVQKPVAQPVKAVEPVAKKPAVKAATRKPTVTAAPAVPAPLTGLPVQQKELSSQRGYSTAALARAHAGEPAGPGGWTDVGLVAAAWRAAGGGPLPADRAALVALARPVPLADARIGDLVVYDRPAVPHVGVYLGGGQMVDASPKQGRVVMRPVYSARSVRLLRLG